MCDLMVTCNIHLQDFEKTKTTYTLLLRRNWKVHLRFADALMQKGEFLEATLALEKLINDKPLQSEEGIRICYGALARAVAL